MLSPVELLEKEIEVEASSLDLTWFTLSGEINSAFSKKQVPMRFTCLDITDKVTSISRNGHVVALYLKDIRRLYRIEGSLMVQWCMIRNGFNKIIDNLTVIE